MFPCLMPLIAYAIAQQWSSQEGSQLQMSLLAYLAGVQGPLPVMGSTLTQGSKRLEEASSPMSCIWLGPRISSSTG